METAQQSKPTEEVTKKDKEMIEEEEKEGKPEKQLDSKKEKAEGGSEDGEEDRLSGDSSDELTLNDDLQDLPESGEVMELEHSDDCSTCASPNLADEEHIEEILRNINEPNSRYDWTTLAIRAGITTVIYPTQMAQILMQVGYEPFPPRRSVTLLGRPCLLLPSTGGYLRYIYHVDGIRGIYRGLIPRISQQLLFTYVFDSARCQLRKMHVKSLIAKVTAKPDGTLAIEGASGSSQNGQSEDSESDSVSVGFFDHFREVLHDLVSKITAIVVSYPVHVVVVRTIAHFIGREDCIRRGLFGEIRAIYSDFGLMGFYRGLVPKLIGETCQTIAVGALAFFVSNQAPGAELRSLLNVSFSILVSAWTYQFQVVSATMAVNGSCLKIGQPPLQPVYDNWIQCWKELGKLNVLNRGSSIVCRYYTGPTLLVNGWKEPTGMYFGPNHLGLRKLSIEDNEKIEKMIMFPNWGACLKDLYLPLTSPRTLPYFAFAYILTKLVYKISS